MTVDFEFPQELIDRLQAEAARRGRSVSEVAADVLDAHLPEGERHRLAFVGIGSSGRPGPIDIHQERATLAAQKIADAR